MLRTLELLKDEIFNRHEVLDFKSGDDFYFLKIEANIIDGSELHIKEYISAEDSLYSYHWQDKDGSLRVRWDNSPHHKGIKTFPHYKHTLELEESAEISLEDVIKVIKGRLGR